MGPNPFHYLSSTTTSWLTSIRPQPGSGGRGLAPNRMWGSRKRVLVQVRKCLPSSRHTEDCAHCEPLPDPRVSTPRKRAACTLWSAQFTRISFQPSFSAIPSENHIGAFYLLQKLKTGLVRDLNPGPLAPEARIIPLDQRADAQNRPWTTLKVVPGFLRSQGCDSRCPDLGAHPGTTSPDAEHLGAGIWDPLSALDRELRLLPGNNVGEVGGSGLGLAHKQPSRTASSTRVTCFLGSLSRCHYVIRGLDSSCFYRSSLNSALCAVLKTSGRIAFLGTINESWISLRTPVPLSVPASGATDTARAHNLPRPQGSVQARE